jgi:hypothetical protein
VELGFGVGDGYFRLTGRVDGINRPGLSGIFFQRLSLFGQVNPVKFGGSVGFVDRHGAAGNARGRQRRRRLRARLRQPDPFELVSKGRLVIGDLFDTRVRLCANGLVEGGNGFHIRPIPLLFEGEGCLSGWDLPGRGVQPWRGRCARRR